MFRKTYCVEEGMLLDTIENVDADGDGKNDSVRFRVRNQFFHGSNPLGWMKALHVKIDGESIPPEDLFFVVRDQWICSTHLSTIEDIWWKLGEVACVYARKAPGVEAGSHLVEFTLRASIPFNRRTIDRRGTLPCFTCGLSAVMTLEG